MRLAVRDAVAGVTAAMLSAAYAASYSALLFPGALSPSGAPIAMWALLFGASVGGAWIAWRTSLPPIASGLDSSQAATFAALSAILADTLMQRGAAPALAAREIMLVFVMVGVLYSGATLAVGYFRFAQHLRLVPYGVVAGFLVATGAALVSGGAKLTLGATPLSALAGAEPQVWLRVAGGVGVAAAILSLRRLVATPYALPALVLFAAVGVDVALAATGTSRGLWYLSAAQPEAFVPAREFFASPFDWALFAACGPDAFAIVAVGMIANVVKLVSLESQRRCDVDLDREFRANGVAGLLTAVGGGLPASPIIAPTQALSDIAGPSRWSGVVSALVLGLALATHVDLLRYAPLPVLGGLIMAMGVAQMWRPLRTLFAQRDLGELAFVALVAVVCMAKGFAVGVAVGFVGACLIFAFNYSRIGVIRRQATRASVSSRVEYAPDLELYLAQAGRSIQLYWLSGYVFFGSADSFFKQARDAADANGELEYVVLDFSAAPGADSSALECFDKLRAHLERRGVVIVCSGMAPGLAARFERSGLIGGASPHRAVGTWEEALAWCESRVLDAAFGPAANQPEPETSFMRRLALALDGADPTELARYLTQRRLETPGVVYAQGTPADEMNFVVSGDLTIALRDSSGTTTVLRRLRRDTTVGEMGFFRRGVRSADVIAERPVVLYTLTRDAFDRMRAEKPALAAAFALYIVRTLADRLEFANRQISAAN